MGVVKLSQWLSFQKDMPLSVFPVERNNVTVFHQLYYKRGNFCADKNCCDLLLLNVQFVVLL